MVKVNKSDALRRRFSVALSQLYRKEVPRYGDLLNIVDAVNAAVVDSRVGEVRRIGSERHGAIRVGSASELADLTRIFAVMGMVPVDYYDLAAAGLPVHSTAFRPIERDNIEAAPFRIFTSLLRIDLLPAELQGVVHGLLARRRIVTPELMRLTARFETDGVLTHAEEKRFIDEAVATFRWRGEITVDADTFTALRTAHPLVADIAAFPGPHINHLTPRTVDIDAAQAAMRAYGLPAKTHIEGPPRREAPILLRQTSFRALDEPVQTPSGAWLQHATRFGEIEQRGAALSRAGRVLYDGMVATPAADQDGAFSAFPDGFAALRREGLALFEYHLTNRKAAHAAGQLTLDALIAAGAVEAVPITYEDFLPVSAAAIFRSNLGGTPDASRVPSSAREAFEIALGRPVIDSQTLYEDQSNASLHALADALGYDPNKVSEHDVMALVR